MEDDQTQVTIVVNKITLGDTLKDDIVRCAEMGLEKHQKEADVAGFIVDELNKKYEPSWHCIVGTNFGSKVTHEEGYFLNFKIGKITF